VNLKDLALPFEENEIEWRIGQSGMREGKPWAKCLAYIQARAIMNRLDDVCGPENWKVNYSFVAQGVICHLSIKVGDEWVSKEDGSEFTEIESFKGGISSALKRAAVPWGIGRYLYSLEAGWAEFCDKNRRGSYSSKIDNQWFSWLPPLMPEWALPKNNWRFPAGKLAQKRPEDCEIKDLIDLYDSIEAKYQGKEMPRATQEVYLKIQDEMKRREGN